MDVSRGLRQVEGMEFQSSPDQRHEVQWIDLGEIPFGPAYGEIKIQGQTLAYRVFGRTVMWSPDSRYLALQEWLSTCRSQGPYTKLLILDFVKQQRLEASTAKGGFISPLRFEQDKVIYLKEYFKKGTIGEYEMDLQSCERWLPWPELCP